MRTQAVVFLVLILVTVAGAVLPRIGERTSVEADIGDPMVDRTHVLLDQKSVPGVARNLILAALGWR